jgi:hypothetical protein
MFSLVPTASRTSACIIFNRKATFEPCTKSTRQHPSPQVGVTSPAENESKVECQKSAHLDAFYSLSIAADFSRRTADDAASCKSSDSVE